MAKAKTAPKKTPAQKGAETKTRRTLAAKLGAGRSGGGGGSSGV